MFVCVEGINGCGKDSLIRDLCKLSIKEPEQLVYYGSELSHFHTFSSKPSEDELKKIPGYSTPVKDIKDVKLLAKGFLDHMLKVGDNPGIVVRDNSLKHYPISICTRWNLTTLVYTLVSVLPIEEAYNLVKDDHDCIKFLNHPEVKEVTDYLLEEFGRINLKLPNKIVYIRSKVEDCSERVVSRNDGRLSSLFHNKKSIFVTHYLFEHFIQSLKYGALESQLYKFLHKPERKDFLILDTDSAYREGEDQDKLQEVLDFLKR